MNKVKYSFMVVAFLVVMFFACTDTKAASVQKGMPGQTISGDYVVIVNTNKDSKSSQPTGILNFNGNVNTREMVENANDYSELQSSEMLLYSESSTVQNRALVTYNIGDKKTFYQGKEYVCIGIGSYSYIWMESSLKAQYDLATKTEQAAKDIMSVYEGKPYRVLNELSNNNIVYKDNSGKLSILLEEMTTSAGFFAGEADITAIHIKAKKPSEYTQGDFSSANGLLVHEGQHALFLNHTCGDSQYVSNTLRWLNEALAVASMDWNWGGSDPSGWLDNIPGSVEVRNGSSIFYDTYSNDTAKDYSLPYLFIRYLINQSSGGYNPVKFIQNVYKVSAVGKDTETFLNEVLSINGINVDYKTAIENFYVAVIAQEKTGVYGFYGDPIVWNKIREYPIYSGQSGKSVELTGTSAIVLKTQNGKFTVPSNGGSDIRYIAVSKGNSPLKPNEGEGTEAKPYVISEAKELNALSEYPNAYFELKNNIVLDNTMYFTIDTFTGTLDGKGYKISNLSKPLITTNRGVIKNLNIEANVYDEFNTYYGTIASVNQGKIMDCSVTGNIVLLMTGKRSIIANQAGGIVGRNEVGGRIERSYIDANINVTLPQNHGIIGGAVRI